jgi:prepilin-type N-terminal cleavage/methylation domain-containing protein
MADERDTDMRRHVSGFTLIELLVVIAVVIVALGSFAALFLSEAERRTCVQQLERVQAAGLAYANNQTDQLLCRNFKSLLEEYNKTCGEQLGVLQAPDCK